MSAYLREDLHTDRSIQLDSECETPQNPVNSSIYLDKMEAHLAFMEKEFKRNMDWQRNLLIQIKKSQKEQNIPQRKSGSTIALRLKPKEEEKLKEVLREYCFIPHSRLQLSQLIRLAINLKEKGPLERERDKENQIIFPHFPRVITLNDVTLGTQHNLEASKVSPIRVLESKVKVPKYRKTVKSPHQLFSPEPEELPKMMGCIPDEPIIISKHSKQQKAMEDSLGKRLNTQGDNNFVTFREYLGETFRNKPSENVSLNFSASRKEDHFSPEADKESLLLLSQEEEHQRNPSIYLQLKLTKQAEQEKCKKEQEFLRFSATKKRKISKSKERAPRHPLPRPEESRVKIKKLHDSFGKIYEEFEQMKLHQHNDRETLESDD